MATQRLVDPSETSAERKSPVPTPQEAIAPKPRPFSARGFTSLLLTLSFLVMSFSGVMLYLTPRGRVANWTDWTLLGLGKEEWAAVHMNNSILFVAIAAIHLAINWSMFFGYLKKRAIAGLHMKKELAAAAVLAAVVAAGTIYGLPPFSSVMALNHQIKDYWEQSTARAPVPHSEELTLAEFAGHLNLPMSELSDALRKEGFDADPSLTVEEVGRNRGVAPRAVLAAVQKHYPEAGATAGRGPGWGRGRGLGQGRGAATIPGAGCSGEVEEKSACPEARDGDCREPRDDCSGPVAEAGTDDFGPGPGRGMGWGRGMGMGRGMGRGRGQGGGGGLGLGPGQSREPQERPAGE